MNNLEKAKELFSIYYDIMPSILSFEKAHAMAIQCSLIVVDEVLNSFEMLLDARLNYRTSSENEIVKFWNDVKECLINGK